MNYKTQIIRKNKWGTTLVNSCFVLLLLVVTACDDFVIVDIPTTQLSSELVFENYDTATAALVAIYAELRDNGLLTGNSNGMQAKLGEYTDEMQFFGAGGQTDAAFFNNIVLPSNADVYNWWNTTYTQIYATNAVLEGVEKSQALTNSQKDQLRGEALLIRALLHFHLTNLFGSIPYVTTTNYKVNTTIAKIPAGAVYENVEADLITAETLLNTAYLTGERIRPNKATVQALLARMLLYSGRWAEAANYASAVLNNTDLYEGTQTLDEVFLKESFSTIWQLKPAEEGNSTLEGLSSIFIQGPPPVSALSGPFVNSFEEGDERATTWIKAVTDGTEVWHHAYKYKAFENSGSSPEYSIVFRTAEQYLIRAEARVKQGDLLGAREDLNKIRNQAGLENTTAATELQIMEAITKERRSELFMEAHRFFDLKRADLLNVLLPSIKPGWNNNDRLLPLPQTELLLNPNLNPQNPGY